MPSDFFISRTGADAQWAQWIGQVLQSAGYTVILQDWNFHAGEDFVAKMDAAMRSSDRTIAVLSRHYDSALFTVPEWTNAIARDPTGRDAVLVPVRVDDIVPEGIFKTRVYIDLFGATEAQARQRLLDGVQRGRRASSVLAFPGEAVTARFPGALPPIWRTPSQRNPVFTGRDAELNELRSRFSSADPPPQVVALVGTGGIGKTALAVEYAHRDRDRYKVVWWVRGERRETAAADLALLADQLELVGKDEALNVRVEATRTWLAGHDRWLLIVDDVDDPGVARIAIPAGGGGNIILTSRRPVWRRQATVMDLNPLVDDAGTQLVERRSGQHRDDAMSRLVRIVGGLPLALELAGAFLEQQGVGAAEYLARLQRRGGLPVDDDPLRPPDYNIALNAVWSESFKLVAAESPTASDLLRLSAYLAPDDVPRPALTRGARRLPPALAAVAADPDGLADTVARPRALSLVTTSGDGFSMHRLVQAALRDSLAPAERAAWATTAILLMEFVLPLNVDDFRLWGRTGRLIGHAVAAAQRGVELMVGGESTIKLLDRGATYLSSAGGEPDEIADARTQAIQFGEKLPEGPPPWLLNNHAIWLTGLHKADEAEALLRRAVEVTRRREGGNAPSLGVQWVNLGAMLKERGEIEEARKCLLRGVTILDRYPAGAKGATAHSLLGQVLFELGNKPAAAGHFAEAVRAYDAALGPGSLDGITARAFLAQARGEDPNKAYVEYTITSGSIHADEGGLLASSPAWHDDAEQLLRQAISEGARGAAVELSQLLRKKGRDAEADSTLQAAAKAGDPEALYWHARELADAGDRAAESEIRRSIGAGNVFSNYDLGLLLASDPARRGEAEQAFRAAVDAGYDIARNDLGILLCEWPGREREGEAMLAEAGRRGHTRSWANLATYLREHGRNDEAIVAMRAAAEDGYLRAYGTLAYFLEELGRFSDALAAFRAGIEAGELALKAHLASFCERHPEVAGSGL